MDPNGLKSVWLGLIYLPAVVMVGYYFEKKRALATGTVREAAKN